MKKRLGKMRTAASNRMIAEVLGVPLGTVDSSLYAIKNRATKAASTNDR
jgi:DNA-directed RNA polymerase specialized sigma24 family protein